MNKVSGGQRREPGHSAREPTVSIQAGSMGSVEVSVGSEPVGTSLLRLSDSPWLPDLRGDGCQLPGIGKCPRQGVVSNGPELFSVILRGSNLTSDGFLLPHAASDGPKLFQMTPVGPRSDSARPSSAGTARTRMLSSHIT